MGWPLRQEVWRKQGKPAQDALCNLALTISRYERVAMLVRPSHYETVRALLPAHIRVVEMSYEDVWLRDIGPSFLRHTVTGEQRAVDWVFNGWGGNSCSTSNDDALVARKILSAIDCPRYACPLVMEGGAFHVDGEGTLLTTEECVLNSNRQLPGGAARTRESLEQLFAEYLGVRKVIWLPNGISGDSDTNGHIDNFASFTAPGHVLLHWTDDEKEPQHAISQEALRILSAATDARGRSLVVHKIPQPPAMFSTDDDLDGLVTVSGSSGEPLRSAGTRLPGSYVNFYLANGSVIVPSFGVSTDKEAEAVMMALFPSRTVVMVPSRELLLGGGNIHCLTQQQPKLQSNP
jgi:agmatine deiminase